MEMGVDSAQRHTGPLQPAEAASAHSSAGLGSGIRGEDDESRDRRRRNDRISDSAKSGVSVEDEPGHRGIHGGRAREAQNDGSIGREGDRRLQEHITKVDLKGGQNRA